MKKIAIVGAGFSGLSVCYHLLQKGETVTVFDGKGIGGGASGIASGLLHPYPGASARLSWKGEEALREAKSLLEAVGPEVYKETGILRLALNEKQEKAFRQRAEEREDIEWWSAEQCHVFAPGIHYLPGIFVKSGITVHASLYLKGLWKVCEKGGARFEQRQVALSDLGAFDQVVLAAGGGIRLFEESRHFDLEFNKGQILVCDRPKFWQEKTSLTGKGYLAVSEKQDQCYLGSTYERNYHTEDPCLGTASDLILLQASEYLPAMGAFRVQGCRAAMRVTSSKSYHPIACQIGQNLFVMTGMGSRGLLYHGYLGKALTEMMRSA